MGIAQLGFSSTAGSRPKKVPTVAGNIHEDDDLPVRLLPRLGQELHVHAAHPLVGSLEVVNAQEQPDAAGELISDHPRLALTVRLREQQRGRCAGRSHHDPPLGSAAASGQGRLVLNELEAEDVYEEPDGLVVVVDKERELFKVHPLRMTTAI